MLALYQSMTLRFRTSITVLFFGVAAVLISRFVADLLEISSPETQQVIELASEVSPTETNPLILDPVVEDTAGPLAFNELEKLGAPNKIFDRNSILKDRDGKIPAVLGLTPALNDRVGFWFDVYTRYDSHRRIIHDAERPWLVYKVIDVSPIIFAKTPRKRWLRNVVADKKVEEELKNFKKILKRIATGKLKRPSTDDETLAFQTLKSSSEDLRKLAKKSSLALRVQTGQKDFFEEGLKESGTYLPQMEEIFNSHQLPVELTRLPLVESSFNHNATSKAGASGIWQFMNHVSKNYMIVGQHIDERRSPIKATEGAAELLKENYLILSRSWPLAVTAYNHGPKGLKAAIRKYKTRDFATILEKYRGRQFGFASQNYYCEFLAALLAEKYQKEVFGDLQISPAISAHLVPLPRAYRARALISKVGIHKDEFLRLNPDLVRAVQKNALIPKSYRLQVPTSLKTAVQKRLALRDGNTSTARKRGDS